MSLELEEKLEEELEEGALQAWWRWTPSVPPFLMPLNVYIPLSNEKFKGRIVQLLVIWNSGSIKMACS